MNIIFGSPNSELLEKYTVLELDTFKMLNNKLHTSYCVIEKIPLEEFAMIDALKKIHADLIHYYRLQHWDYCLQAIEGLTGKWNGELDTFYNHMTQRIKQYQESPPPESWDGTILKDNNDLQLTTE
jgi:hypothetical protein